MERINQHQIFALELASDLRLNGFCSIMNSKNILEDVDILRKYLISEFSNILFVEVNDFKKYFVVSESGKATVIKLIDNSIFYAKRLWVDAEQRKEAFEKHKAEWERLKQLRSMISLHKFEG